MTKKVVKINKDTVYSSLKRKNKGNKTRKDYNILIDSIKTEVKDIFFY
jgi:hypothetical protein